MKQWFVMVMAGLVVGCGRDNAPPAPSADVPARGSAATSARSPAPPKAAVSPICRSARELLGARAACVEAPLPELATPAGAITRVHDAHDPIRAYVYVLAKPSGQLVAGRASSLAEQVLAGIDPAKTSPELLARLYAALSVESAAVRCVDPADRLPAGTCAAPSRDAKGVVTVILDEFADPRLFNRGEHAIRRARFSVTDGRFHGEDSDSTDVYKKDPPSTRPASLPPLPEMTAAPDWAAPPVAAAPDESAKLCAAAGEKLGDSFAAHRCQAFGYPSLKLPNGELFYLANDAGQRWPFAFRQTDGTILAGTDLDEHSPLAPIVKAYDPVIVPPATLAAALLLVHPDPARIRCIGGDAIQGVTCKAPDAQRTPDGVRLSAIIEELPIPDEHGTVHDPAIRSYTWDLTPGGGFSGDSDRLVDLRDAD